MQVKPTEKIRNNRIRILEIIGNAERGGMENYIQSLLESLPPSYQFTFVCPNESHFTNSLRKRKFGDVYIARMDDDPYWRSVQMVTELGKILKTDLLHAHMPKAHVLAGIAGTFLQKPVVASIHGMDITAYEAGVAKTVNSHLITNNQEAYVQGLALGISPSRLYYVRNGTDPVLFGRNQPKDACREALQIPREVPLIGFAGRLDYDKGPDIFLKIANEIHQKKPEIHFAICGDGPMKNELKAYCKKNLMEQVVHFLNWREDTWHIYPAFDILAHTSRSDGTSLVLMEAMACGIPTVALRVGGVPEVVEHGSTGYLLANWEDGALCIMNLLQNAELLRQMTANAIHRVREYFDVKRNTGTVSEIFKHILALHAKKGMLAGDFSKNQKIIPTDLTTSTS